MKQETKQIIKKLYRALVEEYGNDFECALAPKAIFFSSEIVGRRKKGRQEYFDVESPALLPVD
jgi:hypothetical protein